MVIILALHYYCTLYLRVFGTWWLLVRLVCCFVMWSVWEMSAKNRKAEQLCFDFFVWLTMCLEASIFFEFFFPIWRTRDGPNIIRGTKSSFLPPPPLFRLSVTVWCDSQFARLNGSIFGFCRKTLGWTRFFVSPQDSLSRLSLPWCCWATRNDRFAGKYEKP